jgi:signal transduction histidine kinase
VPTTGHPITRWLALALIPVSIAYALAATAVATRHGELTTYAGRSGLAAVAELAAGLALFAVGFAAWLSARWHPTGPVAVAAAFAWFAPDWIGWESGPAGVRVAALAVAGVTAAAVVHLALGAPTGRPSSAPARAVVALTWGATAAIGAGRALFYDPLADPGCTTWCATNPLLAHGDRALARALDWADLVVAALATAAVVVLGARRLVRASPALRAILVPIVLPAAIFLGAWAARAATLAVSPGDDPRRPVLAASFAVRAVALCAFAAGLGWALSGAARRAHAVRRLAREHIGDPGSESFETALIRATGDTSLRVIYPRPKGELWIDSQGRHVAPPERRADRALTAILREGLPVAVVAHDPATLDGSALEREIGTAARLGLDNERLRAEAQAQLRELRTSRARIIELGDAERRRLERDLHDGAQQRLVGLSVAVRIAQGTVDERSDPRAAASLRAAGAGVQRAIAELRELAHGIHPVELSEEGLGAALETLGDFAPVTVRVLALPAERLPAAVETAAYVVVDEAARRAAGRSGRTTIEIAGRRANGAFVLDVLDPGEASADRVLSDLADAADRVKALEGRLSVANGDRGVRITAELPCA